MTLLESGPYLMKRQLDPETAAHLEQALAGKGIPTVTGARAQRIAGNGDRLELTYSDSEESLVAGMIVFATGVRPRDELARQFGPDVDPRGGGIVVDDQLRTTDACIHAIGDCASHEGVSYGLVAPGYRMSETLAEILAGRKKRFSGYVPAVRLRLSGIDVWSLGKPDERGVRVNWSGDGVYRRVTVRATRIQAAAAIGPWHEIGYTQDMIRQRRRATALVLHQFIQTGSFTGLTEAIPVTEWPPASMVCNCLEVTRGDLGTACEEGCASVDACLACHADEHTLAYTESPHYELWQAEISGDAPPGSGVSCASCHLPRETRRIAGDDRIVVQHNQNANLRPNEKMIRDVCLTCHSLELSIDALADTDLIRHNFTGTLALHVPSIDMALSRLGQD